MPDFALEYASMGDKAGDAALPSIRTNIIAAGMVGLLMSSNVRCNNVFYGFGVWTRAQASYMLNYYSPILRQNATQKELVGKVS